MVKPLQFCRDEPMSLVSLVWFKSQDIMIPYVYNILPALYDNPAAAPLALKF